jgi:hypothetical protein
VLLELTVDPEDLGRVIGKRGATAQSLRTLLRALGTKNDARYNLKIVDVGDGGPRPQRSRDDSAQTDAPADDTADDVATTDDIDDIDEEEAEAPTSDVVSRTRAELADLDDLDV